MAPPRKRTADPISANALAFTELVFHLQDDLYSQRELADLAGISIHTIIRWFKLLRRPGKRLIHIADWRRNHLMGRSEALWEWGPGKNDVKEPLKKDSPTYLKEYNARRREKNRLARLQAASQPTVSARESTEEVSTCLSEEVS